jgi:hypothetical protein
MRRHFMQETTMTRIFSFILLVSMADSALAVNSGNAQYFYSSPQFLCNGSPNDIATATLAVSVSSTILINAHVIMSGQSSGSIKAVVDTVAYPYSTDSFPGGGSGNSNVYNLNEYPGGPDTTALVLSPGAYTIHLQGQMTCSPTTPAVINGVIGWALFSSAYDRIFADGFGTIG